MSMQGQKGNLSAADRRALGGGGRRGSNNPADPALVGHNSKRGGSTGATTSLVPTVTAGSYGGAPKKFGRKGNPNTTARRGC